MAIGYANVVTGNNSGAIGDPNVVSGNSSYVLGNNNTVAANNVFVLGNNVTVAAGNDGAVVLGDGSTASGANTVSVGSANQTRRITNVAPGINGTDAVNVNQLTAGLASANVYTDTQVFDLRRTTSYGIAGVTAMTMIPDMDSKQNFSIGVGGASFDGFEALGVAVSARLGEDVKLKAGASISGGTTTYGGGLSVGF